MFSEDGYRALVSAAGLVRRADRGVLVVTGADRLSWLQGLLTNDVLALPPRGICDAAYLTPQGRMITDMRVAHFDDRTLLDVPAPLSAALAARLDALLFSEDARIADLSADTVLLELHGPGAPTLARGLDMIRDDAYGVPGFCLWINAHDAASVTADLAARGATPTTLETLDVVRVEAGRPAFLIDMDEQTIPLEAGLEQRAISFTKGCYVGQEVIVRVTHRGGGRVARRLVGLIVGRSDPPHRGDVLVVGARDVGRLTSVVWSPARAATIALGYVHRDFIEPGTGVHIKSSGGDIPAEVAALPFVSR